MLMKVSKLLASGALLLAGGAAAQAAIVDGVRQKPEPAKADLQFGETMYLYNAGAKMYFRGSLSGATGEWNTRAHVSGTGYKVRFSKHIKADATEWDGQSVIFEDSVETQKAWKMVWFAGATKNEDNTLSDNGQIWIDWKNQSDTIWKAIPQGNGLYRLTVGDDNPNSNTENFPNLFVGVEGTDTHLWSFLDPNDANNHIDWYFVTPEEYLANQALLPIYELAQQLKAVIDEAKAKGVDVSVWTAIYENEASTEEELNKAIADVKEAIAKAEETQVDVENPIDKTSLLTNSSYDNGDNSGWQGDKPGFGYGAAEHYNKTYNSYQKVTGAANGVYALSLQAFYRAGWCANSYENFNNKTNDLAKLYAVVGQDTLTTSIMNAFADARESRIGTGSEMNEKGSETDGGEAFIPNNMQAAAAYFEEGRYANNTVFFGIDDNEFMVGLMKTSKLDGDWTLFDNWKLTYYGNSAAAFKKWQEQVLADAFDTSTIPEGTEMTVGTTEAYNAVLAGLQDPSSTADVLANIKKVNDATDAVKANIAAWKAYRDAFKKADETVNDEDIAEGDLKSALGDLAWEAEDDFDALTLTTEEVLAKVETLLAAVDNCIKNSVKVGADVTNKFLVNPRYEEGSTGWQGSPTVNGPKDNKCAEKFNCKFDVYQEVKDAPVGVYSITLQGFFRPGDNAVAWPVYSQNMKWEKETSIAVYANSNTSPLKCVYDEVVKKGELFQTESLVGPAPFEAEAENGDSIWFVNDMTNSGIAFSNDLYKSTAFGLVAKAGDVLRIGIKGELDNANQWVCWDNFKMVYEGFKADIIAPQLELALENASAYVQNGKPTQNMSKTALDNLKAAIDKGVEVQAGTDGKAMFDALSALFEAIDKAKASVATFKSLVEAAEELQTLTMTSSASQETKTAALTLYAEIIDGVENNTIEDEQVDAYLAKISELRTKLMIPDEVASDDHAVDFTSVLVTPSFEDENGANSVGGWSFVDTKGSFGNDDTQKAALLYEFYEKEKVDMYQDIVGLPNGTYAITANAFCRMGSSDNDLASYVANPDTVSNAFIYGVSGEKMSGKGIMPISAGYLTEQLGSGAEKTIQINGADVYIPNDMVSANAYFEIGKYLNTVIVNVTDGKLRVGVRKDEKVTSDWLIIDNFKLYYFGDNSSKNPDADPTGINDVRLDQAARVEFFNIKGEKLNAAQKGINIMKMTQKDGTVVVKKVTLD